MAGLSAGDSDGVLPQSRYPVRDEAALATLDRKQEDVLKALFGDGLSERQIAEMKLSLSVQTVNSEALHRIPLSNADEPAFMFHATASLRR